MPLAEHLRELRRRILWCALAFCIAAVVAWVFYDQIFEILRHPADVAVENARAAGKDVQVSIVGGVGSAFGLQFKISAYGALVLSSPVWLYHLWRFITPGLRMSEKKWAVIFLGTAIPLFLVGMTFSYLVMAKGVSVLFGFTPEEITNVVRLDNYLTFVIQVSFFFGLGFVLPVFIVMLNAIGVVSSRKLWGWWRQIIFGVVLFAAVATPTGDPVNLSLLAGPIMLLVFTSLGIASLNDRRKRKRREAGEDYEAWDDEEASPLDTTPSDIADDGWEPADYSETP